MHHFQRQHEELGQLAAQISKRLSVEEIERDHHEVRRMVARFAGKLRMHATMENDALYPRLRAHPDPEIRAAAEKLWSEVSGIYAQFDSYSEKWLVGDAIVRDPKAFMLDTHTLFATLGKRMQRENRELYPLVEKTTRS
jgi:hypothetical protein